MPGTKTASRAYFYSRPCGRGDVKSQRSPVQILPFLLTPLREGRLSVADVAALQNRISTHAPAGGATQQIHSWHRSQIHFYSRPCGRGDVKLRLSLMLKLNFYSRPCGRGDDTVTAAKLAQGEFLLTPLREGRQGENRIHFQLAKFLLTPLREGRLRRKLLKKANVNFYSRPCGRGDRKPEHGAYLRH